MSATGLSGLHYKAYEAAPRRGQFMAKNELSGGEFWRQLELYERDGLDAFLRASGEDVRDAIAYLILHRELLRDDELARLEAESRKLLGRLRENDQRKLIEELTCFKEILALQKRLLEEHGSSRR